MIVRIQWLCCHVSCLRAYKEPLVGPLDPYVWSGTLRRAGMTANLIGVMDMTDDKFALVDAIRKAGNAIGIINFWWIKIHRGRGRIVWTQ